MKKNVGKADRTLRFLFALFLLWLGLFSLNGINGKISGIIVALFSLMPFTTSISGRCPVFRWFRFHSLSKKELEAYGKPYGDKKDRNS